MGTNPGLQRANEVRVWRAEQKRRIRAGDVEFACRLLQSGDDRLDDLEIGDFLVWLPGIGRDRATRIINDTFQLPSQWAVKRTIGKIDLMTLLRICREIREREERIASPRAEKARQRERAKLRQRSAA